MKLEEKLKKLGYSPEWIEFGILTQDVLDKQIDDHLETGHQSTEHYRYGAFRFWLSQQNDFDQRQIESYLHLAKCDPDQMMAGSAIIDLLRDSRLSDDDFCYVVNAINEDGEWITKEIAKARLIRLVRDITISDIVFDKLIDEGDSYIHQKLLEHPDVSRNRMKILSERGASKAIRNVAKQKFNTNKLWRT